MGAEGGGGGGGGGGGIFEPQEFFFVIKFLYEFLGHNMNIFRIN